MNIISNYNFYRYNSPQMHKPQSFGAASDINLEYIYNNRMYILPERMQKVVKEKLEKGEKDLSLRDLHLEAYKGLLDCKTLDEARNLYPEFREVLPCNAILQRHTKNIQKIEKVVSVDDLPLYLLQERWGKLKNIQEIIETFGLRGRGSIGWIMEKIRIPQFHKNYQTLLNSTDEERNNIIAEKTRAFNRANADWVRDRNTKLSQDPRNRQLNEELANRMWDRLEHVKADMRSYKADHPELSLKEFDEAFWDAHPQHKEELGKVRKEIGEERRRLRLEEKKKALGNFSD